jgi:LAGLIDADG DNA endonuclease family
VPPVCPWPKVRITVGHRTREVRSVFTYSLPCFNELFDLFYLDGKKIVPSNIAELLTPLGLAYWICDDGGRYRNTVRLATDGFTLEEVNLLAKVYFPSRMIKPHRRVQVCPVGLDLDPSSSP